MTSAAGLAGNHGDEDEHRGEQVSGSQRRRPDCSRFDPDQESESSLICTITRDPIRNIRTVYRNATKSLTSPFNTRSFTIRWLTPGRKPAPQQEMQLLTATTLQWVAVLTPVCSLTFTN
ncbi:hypothetical protein Nepgr_021978 [Nepenthes gracilis]|uniref:Uncharacterized protein n=1 Tax=Nepenthes gracilis TaxID=150966 RepID=A0AAD3T016_NEPGR|nr:hypothetical protein Nepgr_021978 [Nepenthes gracilis]